MGIETSHADVVVVGAGLAGLFAAIELQQQGKSVIVLDKGRSVGGRMATRRVSAGLADHGAQFFTVRDPVFQKWVDGWIEAKVVYVWGMGWSDGSQDQLASDGHPRYVAHGGMNAVPKHLATSVNDVRVNVQVSSIQAAETGWRLADENGQVYTADALVITPPVPQSLALLRKGTVRLSNNDRDALEKIRYAPNLTGLFVLEGEVSLPMPGAIQRSNSSVSWIANNKQKGISETTVMTVQANTDTSNQMWNDPDMRVLDALRTGLLPYLPDGAVFVEEHLKRWRYAQVTVLHPERCLRAEGLPPLVFAGDAFGGPRVEGAALSGMAAAEALR